jgi:hypothetical protein
MIYDETNSIAYHVLNQIGTWIKGEDQCHLFQIDLEDVNKTFSITIDCFHNDITCLQLHGSFGLYDENDISSNLLSYCNNHFDQDEKNEEIYWINFGTHTIRVELELEFLQLSIYETDKDSVNPIYSRSFNWKE